MLTKIVRFSLIFTITLLAGSTFGTWLGLNPRELSASTYIEQQQTAIHALNSLLPLLGAFCIVLTAILIWRLRENARVRWLLIGVVLCLITASLITRFANQPINQVVLTMNPLSPAPNWTVLRDTWWQWHTIRTFAALGALCLTLVSLLDLQVPLEKPKLLTAHASGFKKL